MQASISYFLNNIFTSAAHEPCLTKGKEVGEEERDDENAKHKRCHESHWPLFMLTNTAALTSKLSRWEPQAVTYVAGNKLDAPFDLVA